MNSTSEYAKKICRYLKDSNYRKVINCHLGMYNNMSDEKYLKMLFHAQMGEKLDLVHPKTFNEKLQWLKLHDKNPLYTVMADKANAKDYVAEKIGNEYIIPTLGIWSTFDDINFNDLPNQFVLKCTHDSGGLVICRDKHALDILAAKKKLHACLKKKYYYQYREWPYKNVLQQIIAEEYMQDGNNHELRDYKFYCFNGVPKFLYLSEGMENHSTARIGFVNTDWTFANFGRTDYKPLESLPQKPSKFDEMLEISRKLSSGTPFLRVDLYEINGRVYFGELTFYPCAGMMPFDPPEADLLVGNMLDLTSWGL